MAKTPDLDPKLYQEIIDRMKTGQPLDDLLSKYDPMTIRDILENATAKFSGKTPVAELFEKPDLFKKVTTRIDPKLKELGKVGFSIDSKTGLYLPEHGITKTLRNPLDKATDIHESQHIYDIESRPEIKQPLKKSERSILSNIKNELELGKNVKSTYDLRGLGEATASMASHFKPDAEGKFNKLKQLVNLENIVKGNPLKAIAPLAIGAAALGVGQKAMAGDTTGAAVEAADQASYLVPGLGEARIIGDMSMGELGDEGSDPASLKGSVFEKEEEDKFQKKFGKTKERLNK